MMLHTLAIRGHQSGKTATLQSSHYRSSNGKLTPIKAMVAEHLDNTIAKLSRTGRDYAMLEALRAEKRARGGK